MYDYNATSKGYQGQILLARHHDVQQKNIVNLSKYATDLLGYPYNKEEIVRIAARIGMSALGFNDNRPNNTPRREFICSEYTHVCFKSIGINIDYDPLGFIAPADFARHPRIEALSYIQTVDMSEADYLLSKHTELI